MEKFVLPEKVKSILTTLKKKGFEAYAVGGCVRDLLMGRPTKDWDFTTNATPEEILLLFPDGFYNNAFGTVGIPVHANEKTTQGEVYEITTYRTEQGYSDGRHPDKVIWGTSLDEDLKRRDFTINSIAYDGEMLFDPFNGQEDMVKQVVRAVGDADERFSEDALRMIRAIRIAAQMQFTIEEKTFLSIQNKAHLIGKISSERIRDELIKILSTAYADEGMLLLKNSGLLGEILPELDRCFGVAQQSPKRHHIYDVGTHLLKSLKYCPTSDPIVRLATVLHDVGKYETFNKTPDGVITFYNHEIVGASIVHHIAARLRLSKGDREKLVRLVRWHQFSVDERQTDSALRRFIRSVGKEYLNDILALRTGDRLGGGARETSWRLELYKKRLEEVQIQPFSIQDLKINGYDVMKTLDSKPGPMIGKILEALFKEVEEDKEKNSREYLLKRIPEISFLQGDTLRG